MNDINTTLQDIDEKEINSLNIVSPIDFMSDAENKNLLRLVTQRLQDSSNPNKWMNLEHCEQLAKEIFNI